MAAKTRRPPKTWIRHCITKVKAGAKKAHRRLKSAGAVCGNTWYHVMDKAAQVRAKRRHPEGARGHR